MQRRAEPGLDLLRAQRFTAFVAGQHRAGPFAAFEMHILQRRPLTLVHPLVAPAGETHQNGVEPQPLAGEPVFEAHRAVVIGHFDQYALLNQLAQSLGQTVPGDAEIGLELVEAAGAEKGIADNQHGPALADDGERSRHRTHLLVYIVPTHMFPWRPKRHYSGRSRGNVAHSF